MVIRAFLIRPRDLLVPPPHDPSPYREREYMQINRSRIERVVDILSKLDSAAARDVRAMADLRYGPL